MHYEHFQEAGVIYSTFNLKYNHKIIIHQEALQPFVQRSHFYLYSVTKNKEDSVQLNLLLYNKGKLN